MNKNRKPKRRLQPAGFSTALAKRARPETSAANCMQNRDSPHTKGHLLSVGTTS